MPPGYSEMPSVYRREGEQDWLGHQVENNLGIGDIVKLRSMGTIEFGISLV